MLCTAMDCCWTLEQPAGSFLEYYPSWRSVMLAIRAAGGPYAVLGLHWDFGSRMCCVTSVFLWNEISLPRLPLPGSGWGTMGPKLQKDIILSPTRQSPICWTEGASSGRHTGVNLRPWKDRRTGQAGSSTKAPRPFERPSSSSQSDHDILANPKALSLQGDVVWPSLLPPWPLYYVYIYMHTTPIVGEIRNDASGTMREINIYI